MVTYFPEFTKGQTVSMNGYSTYCPIAKAAEALTEAVDTAASPRSAAGCTPFQRLPPQHSANSSDALEA